MLFNKVAPKSFKISRFYLVIGRERCTDGLKPNETAETALKEGRVLPLSLNRTDA